jgi:hypothetical protein
MTYGGVILLVFDIYEDRDGKTYLYNPYIEEYVPTRNVTNKFSEITNSIGRNYEFEKAFLMSRLSLAENKKSNNPFADDINEFVSNYNAHLDTATEPDYTRGEDIAPKGDITFLVEFEPSFNADFDTGTVLIFKILCPTRVGGDVSDTLYLTSTNRATYGVETVIHYLNSQTDLYFMIWEWAPGKPYPVQVYTPYSELGDYLTQDTVHEICQQFIQVQSQTVKVSTDSWKNLVYLYNYNLNVYDLVYEYTYSASDATQKDGNHWWGPFVETFNQSNFVGTNIIGFERTLFASRNSSNNWSTPQLLSETQSVLRGPIRGFELVYLYPNHSFIVTTPAMEFTPGIRGSDNAGTFSLGIARGLIYQLGNYKYVYIHIVINSISDNPSGNLQITGCPYLPVYNETPLILGITSYTDLNLSNQYVVPVIQNNGIIEFESCGSGSESFVNVNQIDQFSTLQVAGGYLSSI